MANLGRCILVLIGTTVSVGEICSALKYSPPLLPPIQSGIEIYYIDSLVLQHLSCSFSCVNGKGDVGRAFRQDGCCVCPGISLHPGAEPHTSSCLLPPHCGMRIRRESKTMGQNRVKQLKQKLCTSKEKQGINLHFMGRFSHSRKAGLLYPRQNQDSLKA